MKAVNLIRQKTNLTDDYRIFFAELELKTSEIEVDLESIRYTATEMLR